MEIFLRAKSFHCTLLFLCDIIYLIYFSVFSFYEKGCLLLLFKGKKIPHSDYIPIIIIGLLLYKLINNPSIVLSEMKGIFKIHNIPLCLYNLGICNYVLFKSTNGFIEKLKIRRILAFQLYMWFL